MFTGLLPIETNLNQNTPCCKSSSTILFLMYWTFLFVADIGGQMGLFLGASIMTFTEFLEFLLKICVWLTRKFIDSSKANDIKSINVAPV